MLYSEHTLKLLNMQYDFVGLGDITIDAFIQLHDWVHEQVDKDGRELCLSFGGKIPYEDVVEVRSVGNSPNATVSAARLGLNTALITHLGKDRIGDETLAYLKRQNVHTEY